MVEGQKEFAPIEESKKLGRKSKAKQVTDKVFIENPEVSLKEEKPAAKVTEKQTKVVEKSIPREVARTQRKRLFSAFINGRERQITVPTYEVIIKDPNYIVELPKDSPLPGLAREGVIEAKPCKDC